jgi:ribonuclease HI
MNSFSLFTDVSLDPGRKLGVGAYLVVPSSFLEVSHHSIERSAITVRVEVKKFEDTSSTKLEVQTVLYALEDFRNELKAAGPVKLQVYTDSQCIAGLLGRRQRLEGSRFISRGKNLRITHASLYRKFYELHGELGFEVIKVAGHTRSSSQDAVDRIFSCVDREARLRLHLWMA